MKVALVTMPVLCGQCEKNYVYMEKQIHRAIDDGADLIVFPQNAITGYMIGDTWLDDGFCTHADSYNDKLMELSSDIAIVWGNIKYRNHKRFNAAFYAYKGKTHMRVKKNQDDYIYQDSRYFYEQDINSAIDLHDEIMALNFSNQQQLADMNINIDARPYIKNEEFTISGTCIYANCVGVSAVGKNVMLYAGGSSIVKNGVLLYQAKSCKEDYAIIDLNDKTKVTREKESLLDVLCMGIRCFDEQVFHKKVKWIVGMSGGLDSSITSALLVKSLGNERVIGFNMASHHNRMKTKHNAQIEAKRLGIVFQDGSIEKLVDASVAVLSDYGYSSDGWDSLVIENIQARIRGHLLASFAQIHGGVIVNNANKVETALGYCTLYGDAVGALSIIGDLTKVDLFALSKEINKSFEMEVIPLNLLPDIQEDKINWEMPPSAELKEEQLDPMKWFYHDYLVEHLQHDLTLLQFMKSYLDESIHHTEVGKWITYYGLDEPKHFIDDLDWFVSLQKRNSFKRLQTPPFLTLTRNAFGSAFVETALQVDDKEYNKLKNCILQMKK